MSVRPITFACSARLPHPPEVLAGWILELRRWPEFTGYGPLPGIRSASFDIRTPGITGTRIRVENCDGSTHIEQIVEWDPASTVRLHMQEFSPPVSRLATRFDETWTFQRVESETHVVRSFALHPVSAGTRIVLWMISHLLKKAVNRHLQQLSRQSGTTGGQTSAA